MLTLCTGGILIFVSHYFKLLVYIKFNTIIEYYLYCKDFNKSFQEVRHNIFIYCIILYGLHILEPLLLSISNASIVIINYFLFN